MSTRLNCIENECIKLWIKFNGDDVDCDPDYILYHCEKENCHNIFYYKSTNKCKKCGKIYCQYHTSLCCKD